MGKNKKVKIENITISDFASEGKCIAKLDGEVIFIESLNIAPGDVVDLLVNRKKKNYSEAKVLKLVKPSEIRVEPFCEHFGACGGCKWQHIPYELQLKQKWQQVNDQLVRIGKLPIPEIKPILGSEKTTFYRNKLEFTFSNSRWLSNEEIQSTEELDKNGLGFHVPKRFDKVIPINKCFLQDDPSNQIRNFLNDYAVKHNLSYYDHIKHEGFFRNFMIRTSTTGQVMVVIQFASTDLDEITKVLDSLYTNFPTINSLNYFINQKRNDSYFDLDPVCYKGTPYIEEEMEGLRFRIGVKSFYQTNSLQAYELYKITREYAKISENDIVYDLYTGTGTIANFVAKKAKKVIGIEYIDAAIEDAKINSQINSIENTDFFAGDMAKVLTDEFVEINGRPDIIITDPPRAGMDKAVIDTILRTNAKRIVYVSCNPATQARDLNLLKEKYKIVEVKPVDMFPHTHHVENVVSLELIN
jgi:23S rRNA (uracil1939-C5)-methyltransferase